ncbi:hypothetical protein A0H81_01164 [Grifola frondosa]|uniref:Uncharacterized protein n=1 Tax=Grifola frondosa TaxID=5627 RepID=A0A1C7MPW8_GRIFR|nr:hypothetical protein A0H81_01164 [Grifola frondosa]
MRDRILEWHRTHPNNLARGQLSSNTNPPAGQMIFEITSNPNVASSYQLTREDRITALEREIFALRKGKETFDGVEIPRHLPARPPIPPAVNRIDNPPTHEPTEASQVTNPPSVSAPAPAASSTPSPATVPAPIHPYSKLAMRRTLRLRIATWEYYPNLPRTKMQLTKHLRLSKILE